MSHVEPPDRARSGRRELTALTVAAWASLGAGAIHAAAIGVHAEHRAASLTFALVAVLQVLWGGAALVAPGRVLAIAGAAGSGLLIGGWVLAKTSGISFIEGLDQAEPAQLPDTAAAVLAAAVAGLGLAVAMGDARSASWRPIGRIGTAAAALAVVGLTVPGLVQTSGHEHAGDGADEEHAHEDAGAHQVGDGHEDDHGGAAPTAAVPPKPYHPDEPIDLGGVEGVTPEQQAAAENLVAVTLARLPQFADPVAAEERGFRSIQDGATGHEHYINWDYIDDEHVLDPDFPESLVYEPQPDGSKRLVSAMFMLPGGSTLDDVPELGGKLTQWHIHDNLCFTPDPTQARVAGLTSPDGSCRPPLVKFEPVPMIHVWITPHPCGPFAALEGVGAGQIAPGETRLCDHAHGA